MEPFPNGTVGGCCLPTLVACDVRPDPIPLDPSDIEDYEEYSTGLAPDDIQALLRDFGQEGR